MRCRFASKTSARDLNDRSWQTVCHPAGSLESYRRALRLAEATCVRQPDYGPYLNTLGVAQYRCGLYREALDTLRQSEPLNAKLFHRSLLVHPG